MADTAVRRLTIAAPASGCGKTTLTLALLAALRRRGVAVAPFKVGPDFIDPGHHARACGRTSRNLDGWMCGEQWVRTTFAQGSAGAELALIEGVMGLFDGAAGDSEVGSTAEVAKWLESPVLLVIDARAQARSAAATLQGFVQFDPRLQIVGVIFNRVGSPGHAEMLRAAVASVPGLPPVLGCLPRSAELALPERHLGLVTAEDADRDEGYFAALAEWVEAHVNLEALLRVAAPPSPPAPLPEGEGRLGKAGAPVRLAVARDAAFCFYYPENLELLEAAGAELVYFSPLTEAALPAGIDGLYLGGGYPELHAATLSANAGLREEIRAAAAAGLPIYAECGGFMYLSEAIDELPMVGVFPARARMLPRRRALGYRELTQSADSPLGPAGTKARGHEFHYSEMDVPDSVPRCYHLCRRQGEAIGTEGFLVDNVLGSYVHLHFGSNQQLAENFVKFCRAQRRF
jgi:cobyrinic acid a,c-diamide synthase